MTRFQSRIAVFAFAIWALPQTAEAHHSLAAFDQTKQIVVEGTVKEFAFANPHSHMVIEERQADGKTKEWEMETGGPAVLFRYNIKADTFKAGEHVTVTAHPLRNGEPVGGLIRVIKADGTTFLLEMAK